MHSSCILSMLLFLILSSFSSKSSMRLNVTLELASCVRITHSPKSPLSISNEMDSSPSTFDILYSMTVDSFMNLTCGVDTLKLVNDVSISVVIREMNTFSAFILYMWILIIIPPGPAYIICRLAD